MRSFSVNETVNALSVDEMAIVFSFLPPTDILRARVCTTWRDAAKKTTVPLISNFEVTDRIDVRDERTYNLLEVMITALPNLQQVRIGNLKDGHKFSHGESAHEDIAVNTAHYRTYNIDVISNLRKLKKLRIHSNSLNGIYPVFFNFPLLQSLDLFCCYNLKWDLSMLSGCPQLRKFSYSNWNTYYERFKPTGNLSHLLPLRNTLEELKLGAGCEHIRGNIMDLADFPHLEWLDLCRTSVTGDIRDIGIDDFPSIDNEFHLPSTVVGGNKYKFQRISDVPKFMQAILPLLQRTDLFVRYFSELRWQLSRDSPDWYTYFPDPDYILPEPPFTIGFVSVGGFRLGWRWGEQGFYEESEYCEINWLEPEPSRESNAFDHYRHRLMNERRSVHHYKGYYQPPTEDEYKGICNNILASEEDATTAEMD